MGKNAGFFYSVLKKNASQINKGVILSYLL